MKIFGKKQEFAIGLEFYVNEFKDDEYIKENLEECWEAAKVYFWVKGKNIFEFINCADSTYASTTLHALVDYFCDFLIFHISDDPFPMDTKATNADEMIEETALIKTDEFWREEVLALDWDKIDMELYDKIDMWIYHHGFIQNRGGAFLPDAYMRKVNDTVEISWHNRYPHENEEREFYFLHKQGVEYVDLELYKDSVIKFCLEYINHVAEKFPEIAEIYIEKLQKTLGIQSD